MATITFDKVRKVYPLPSHPTSLFHRRKEKEEGAMLFDGSSFIKVPVEKCEVVDSVGAGDCHLGTYASFRAMGTDKRKALEKANLFASKVVQHVGSTLEGEDLESLL